MNKKELIKVLEMCKIQCVENREKDALMVDLNIKKNSYVIVNLETMKIDAFNNTDIVSIDMLISRVNQVLSNNNLIDYIIR